MLKLYYGTAAQYGALASKETDSLYFLTDARKVMKGDVDFSESVRFVATMPASPVAGVIYIDASAGGTAKAFDGTKVVNVGTPTVTTIDNTATDGTTPTTLATYTAIQAAIQTAQSAATTAYNNAVSYTDSAITALDLANTYAALAGATFTGTVEAPTPGDSSNDTTVATTAFVVSKVNAVQQALAGAFHFKGTVATEADLANVQNPAEGDVYQVTTTSSGTSGEFAYDGTNWVELGTILDLSGYYTSAQTDSAISTAVAAGVATAEAYADGLASNYDPTGAAAAALQDAKDYADGLASNYDAAGSATAAENAAKAYADSLASNYDAAGSAAAAQTAAEATAAAALQTALTWNALT